MEWTRLQNLNCKEIIMETQAKLEEALSKASPEPLEIATLSAKLESAYIEEETFGSKGVESNGFTVGIAIPVSSMLLQGKEEQSTSFLL